MVNKLNEMFLMQQKLNDETNGKRWLEGKTNKGKTINWLRCVHMEASEFIDSFPWKHWKAIDQEADLQNARIELVDIWHFLMSEAIRTNYTGVDKKDGMVRIARELIKVSYSETKVTTDYELIINTAEQLIFETKSKNLTTILMKFFELCALMDLSFDDLYGKYIAKNTLNKFRQDNGYKEGSYIKIWNGDEDNVVMEKIMNDFNDITAKGLYVELGKEYNKIN